MAHCFQMPAASLRKTRPLWAFNLGVRKLSPERLGDLARRRPGDLPGRQWRAVGLPGRDAGEAAAD